MTLVRFQMCIDGQWRDAQSGKTFDSLNPATAQAWAQLPDADETDVELAVRASGAAPQSRLDDAETQLSVTRSEIAATQADKARKVAPVAASARVTTCAPPGKASDLASTGPSE